MVSDILLDIRHGNQEHAKKSLFHFEVQKGFHDVKMYLFSKALIGPKQYRNCV